MTGANTSPPASPDPQNSINANYNYVLQVVHDRFCLNATGAGTIDATNVDQDPCSGDANQSWNLQAINGGYYQISNVHAGSAGSQVLEVSGQSLANQANVDTYHWTGNSNQQWSFTALGGGIYNIVNRNSGQSLEVVGGQTASGANVDQFPYGSYDNQKWKLIQNQLRNPGFETGDKEGWDTWSGNQTQNASYTEGGAYSGGYRLTHSSQSPYVVYTSQSVTGIANGRYTLSARVTGGGGQTAAYLSAKQFDSSGAELKADILTSQHGWPNTELVKITGIVVQNNQITVGLFTQDLTGGHWLSIDDVTLLGQ